MLPLVASAYYHTGDVEKAMEFYASFGDVSPMYYIANLEDRKLTKFDIIEYSYRGGAKLSHFQKHIKNMVVGAETYPNVVEEGDRPVVSEDLIALRDLAVAAGNDAKCADRAEWLYIAAYIYSQQGLYAQAQNLIAKAERLPLSATLKDSIKVLSIYIEAQTT
jgi:tetratricopeptide (TPR) repeat protein